MKTYGSDHWITLLCLVLHVRPAMLVMLLSTGSVGAQDILRLPNAHSGSAYSITVLNQIFSDYKTGPAGAKPSFSAPDCVSLGNFGTTKTRLTLDGNDMVTVGTILKAISPKHGYPLFVHAPQEFMWWVRVQKSISFLTLGTAVHEANHAVNKALAYCNRGTPTYLFNGTVFKIEHNYGDTPGYGIVAETLPLALAGDQNSRYQQYIVNFRDVPGNDISVLLDEFVAYVGAADMELSIVCSKEFMGLLSPKFEVVDSNAGGMVDFMTFIVAYLKALRVNYPSAYMRVRQQPQTLSLIQTTWAAAETILRELYPYTRLADGGGTLTVSQRAMSTAYSDEFILELDRLGISHVSADSWGTTYLRDKT